MTFAALGLDPDVLRAVAAAGYSEATPIQRKVIPLVLAGDDVIGIAQTGTGKTAAFVLPMIDRLSHGRARARMPRSLILEPTRELAAQVAESFARYGAHHKLDPALLIGGVSFADQDRKLMRGADVLIATPGRLLDHFSRGKLLLGGLNMLVIDEADRMLDMGFIPDIERICALLPKTRQSLLFSATMPPEIARLAERFQNTPTKIQIDGSKVTTGENILQHVVTVPSDDDAGKRAVLRAILHACDVKNGIVFCNRKREVDTVAASLRRHGFDAEPIHGDLPQSVRMRTLNSFRDGALTLLVASDVAARGLDIPDVGHVFNYGPPPNSDDYVHRIGRTGRAGRSGKSFTIVTPGDEKLWAAITERIGPDVHPFSSPDLDRAVAAASQSGPRRDSSGKSAGPRRNRALPRKKRSGGPASKPAPAAPPASAAPAASSPAPATSAGRGGAEERRSGPVDHLPAFLRRPVKRREDDADTDTNKDGPA